MKWTCESLKPGATVPPWASTTRVFGPRKSRTSVVRADAQDVLPAHRDGLRRRAPLVGREDLAVDDHQVGRLPGRRARRRSRAARRGRQRQPCHRESPVHEGPPLSERDGHRPATGRIYSFHARHRGCLPARAAQRSGDRVGARRTRRATRGAAARGVPDAGRRGALQGRALSEAHRAVSRRAVRRRSTATASSARPRRIRLHFDFAILDHTFADIIQGGWLTSHEPDGDWLYGADIGVHPDYRGRGLAQALYAARQEAGVDARARGPGDGRHDERLRRGQAPDDRRGVLRRARRRAHQRSDALDAAARGIRVPRAAQGLPAGSGLRQLQRAHRARRGQGRRGRRAARRRARASEGV